MFLCWHSWLGRFRTSTLGPTTWKLEAFRVFQVMLSLGQMLRISWNCHLEIGTLCYTCYMRDNKVHEENTFTIIYNIWQHQQSIKTALYGLHVTLLDALWDSEPVITMPALSALPLQLIRFSHMNSTCWQRWPFRHRISQPAPTAMAGEKWSGFGKGGHIGRSEL